MFLEALSFVAELWSFIEHGLITMVWYVEEMSLETAFWVLENFIFHMFYCIVKQFMLTKSVFWFLETLFPWCKYLHFRRAH